MSHSNVIGSTSRSKNVHNRLKNMLSKSVKVKNKQDSSERKCVYVAITNIPDKFRTYDLRGHFSALVEGNAFRCFHYRHRPEKPQVTKSAATRNEDDGKDKASTLKCCCVVKVYQDKASELLDCSGQHWTDFVGEIYGEKCEVTCVNVLDAEDTHSNSSQDDDEVKESTLLQMPELRPPEMMDQGNVGTPTLVFLDLIQRCLLPHSLINKLRLQFPKTRSKRLYDTVHFQYEDFQQSDSGREKPEDARPRFLHSGPYKTALSTGRIKIPGQTKTGLSQKQSDKIDEGKVDVSDSTEPDQKSDECDFHLNEDNNKSCDERLHCKATVSSSSGISIALPEQFSSSSNAEEEGKMSLSKLTQSQIHCQDADTKSVRSSDKDQSLGEDSVASKNVASSKSIDLVQKTYLSERQRKKADMMKTRELMAEGIEEHLIAVERKYHNDEDAEEWDRHEQMEDDPSNQERNKERLYEEEIEQPWEKGGPGVVFWTDAIYWQAQEGDFDEQTTDDLDVDMSAYEEKGAGDMDIKDFLKMRQETRFRNGYDKTDRFSLGIAKRLPDPASSATRGRQIGSFEHHGKGMGRRVMEQQGWRDGSGLGRSQDGMAQALRGTGQRPHSKRGLGYMGEERSKAFESKKKRQHMITTIYDNPEDTDPKEPLLCRREPTTLKHRQSHIQMFEK